MTLQSHDFERYFRALWGYEPFPWQQRLARHVLETGHYPSTLALGTGTGKTAVVDVHVFALAVDATLPPRKRRLPRRLFFVVDRRVIVDQTAQRAKRIAEKLAQAQDGVLRLVADALRELSGQRLPLATAVLRGGMVRNDSWARTPDQPMVVSSTVDQVGSRLLFRGYGVSEQMSPIHAGLVGADALIVLDEVHLAEPFRQTLQALQHHYQTRRDDLHSRWQVVSMSATPSEPSSPPFRLDEQDRGHAVLRRRLKARRDVQLVHLGAKGAKSAGDRKMIVAEAVSKTLELLDRGRKAVGVILNRVDLASAVWKDLASRKKLTNDHVTVALVTGRMRPLDKERLEPVLAQLRSDRDSPPEKPIVLVSTQTIEAGADLDFDGIVTQVASMDALQQRMGRLNRTGRLEQDLGGAVQVSLFEPERRALDGEPMGYVLCTKPAGSKDPDPIYGAALDATVSFLAKLSDGRGMVSFAIEEMERSLASAADRSVLLSDAPDAPILLPTYMALWTRTRPRPHPDPEVGPYLHGSEQNFDVQLVWRDDLGELALQAARDGDSKQMEALLARIEAVPPSTMEAVSVPIYAAKAWLAGDKPAGIADVAAGVDKFDDDPMKHTSAGRLALRWRGDESEIVDWKGLRPGDTLLVPHTYGGLNGAKVWSSDEAEPVDDIAERALWQGRRRAVVRPARWPQTNPDWIRRALLEEAQGEDESDRPFENKAELRQAVREWLQRVSGAAPDSVPGWLRAVAKHLLRVGWQTIIVGSGSNEDARQVVLIGNRPAGAEGELDFEPEVPLSLLQPADAEPLTLRAHCEAVADFAHQFAVRLGLPSDVVHDVTLAARLHDVGKADPRFQLMLAGADPVRASTLDEPLAKSRMSPAAREQRERSRLLAGYPKGARHELLSLSLAQAAGKIDEAVFDGELVQHLIASHHGWARPMAPPVRDTQPVDVDYPFEDGHAVVSSCHGLARVGSGVAERFAKLNDRYGPHTLAWLEAIVRLADHRASELAGKVGGR